MATKIGEFNSKLAKIGDINMNVAPNYKIAQFNGATEIYLRPSPVAFFEQKIGCSSAV